ncbi:LytTr DNA-binding region [Emticicia oligotrophica DSM 17448]|uniref:LytTr DNA-binding region n=1 Tax=Emticicia oligotrophica (strain DSM 17448 / CIP 109782 / MTCC 6937 / GPTSA100-15) TaxID=929562 RepID=A0ABN4AKA0_EMTOG|nr:LytTR family DNA-binding domain-containing protein [Emticicia oligotrophica]AFK02613.1 LytTr DNA-binding region [Emticicia oligotrophica DSM 17448]
MLKILRQPYPFGEKTKLSVLLQSLGEGAFIALFLIVFQPLGVSEWHDPNKVWHLIGFGLITTLCGLILRLGIFKTFPKYHNEAFWNVGREILAIMLLILMIAFGNLLYSNFAFHLKISFGTFFWMFIGVMIIGVFPATFGVMLNYIVQLKKYTRPIEIHHHAEPFTPSSTIKLIAENEKDFIELSATKLLYIESSDNYSTIVFEKEGVLQKELLRSSLTRLEGQINYPNIVRCHRSFIVNLDKVANVTGNAQGYKLHLEVPALQVPVARKYSEIVERLK